MSRIADALRKSQTELNAPAGEMLPGAADVDVPWLFEAPERVPEPAAPRRAPDVRRPSASPAPIVADRPAADVRPAPQTPRAPVRRAAGKAARKSTGKEDEQIASAIGHLFLTQDEGAARARYVVFRAVDAGEACGEITARVAEALAARTSDSVCLVDTEVDAPTLHLRYDLDAGPGFADALAGIGTVQAFAHQVPGQENLWVMPAGLPVRERASLSGTTARRRLTELLSAFDYVIVQAAPVAAGEDSTLSGASFDGVVLVLNAKTTRPEAVRAAADSLKTANVRLLGTILRNPSA